MRIKKLLYESFDRNLTGKESQKLDRALTNSDSLNKEKNDLSNLREMILNNTQKDFSADFEFEVFRRLKQRKTDRSYQYIFFNSLNKSFKKLAYATIIFIILTLSYNFEKSGSISIQSALGIKQQNTSLADDFKNLFSFYD
jgi:hypothetical protein